MQVQRLQLHLLLQSNKDIDDGVWYIDSGLDIHRGYKQPEIINEDDGELSDYVKLRLLIARVKALKIAEQMRG